MVKKRYSKAEHPERLEEGGFLLTSGFRKYPDRRNEFFNKSAEMWLKGKKTDDNVYPYWRIHDSLYDLEDFISIHPGGKFWLEATKGTDITEAFEVSHFGSSPSRILSRYFVKGIREERNSPFTFAEDGFYMTLKRKVSPILAKSGTGPDWRSAFTQDVFFASFAVLWVLGTLLDSTLIIGSSSVLLFLSTNSAHNFLHQKDNWRRFYFDWMFLSSRDWRISHALSHHLFPNTIYDYEVTGIEPFFDVLPRPKKPLLIRYSIFVTGNLVYAFGFYFDAFRKAMLILRREIQLRPESLIPLLQLTLMLWMNESWKRGLWLWLVLQTSSSAMFLVHGVAVGHHHPEIFREGDRPSADKDWGMHQVIATKTRSGVSEFFLLASVFFGNHTLHHLFPTVDHSKLPLLIPSYIQTCLQFGITAKPFSFWKLLKGFYLSNMSITPNKRKPNI